MSKNVKKNNSLRSVAKRVSSNVSKETKQAFFVASMRNDDVLCSLLAKCKTQNAVIDFCAKYQKTFDFCVNKLVELNLCKNEKHASTRIKRHIRRDIKSAINSRLAVLK